MKLRARITSSLDQLGGNQYQFDRDAEFKDQLEIQVFEDLALTNPNFLTSSRLLMQTNSQYQLKTTRDGDAKVVSYYVVPKITDVTEDIVKISEHGLVKSGNEIGSCIVMVRVEEAFGVVQQLSIAIEVKSVTFIMSNSLPLVQQSDSKQG